MKKRILIISLLFLFSIIAFSQETENIQQQDSIKNIANNKVLNTEITINFDFNDCKVKDEFYTQLNKFIDDLVKTEKYNAIIYGHADSVGSDVDNKKLGLCRANAVKTYFIDKGILEDRIQVISKGEKAAIADNNTEEGSYKNRRVVINLVERK